MATDYTKVPYYRSQGFQRVPEDLFGEVMTNVVQAAGPMSDEQAMRIVEAVLGPLKLLSPPPHNYAVCDHAYFRYEGGWVFCDKDHGPDDGDPNVHRNGDDEWYSDTSDYRAFLPAPGLGNMHGN